MADKPFVVGITGASGSGKTYFIQMLNENFGKGEVTLLSQDHYYLPIEKQPKDPNGIENFDTPGSIDIQGFIADLKTLISGKAVHKKEYNYNFRDIEPAILTFEPAPIILAEGIFAFNSEELLSLYDYRLFVEASRETRIQRRIKRDAEERGYDVDDVQYRYEHHVEPAFLKFIEPMQVMADLVVHNESSFEKDLSLVTSHLKSRI